jgi:hypothetical protein
MFCSQCGWGVWICVCSNCGSSWWAQIVCQSVVYPWASRVAHRSNALHRFTTDPARLGEGLGGRDVLVPSSSSDSCGGLGTCTLTQSPVEWCFLRHIVAAGFRVKRAVCHEAMQLGRVMFQKTYGSRPSPLLSPYGSCSNKTVTTNWRKRGKTMSCPSLL